MIHKVFSRPRFFSGRLLTAQGLQEEQAYHRDKAQFLNLQLYGTGIVSGLHIEIGQDRSSIIISPGYAIDTYGRDICVPCEVPIALPPNPKGLSVWIRYAEAEAAPIPELPSLIESDSPLIHTQIEEGFEIDFASIPGRVGGQQPMIPPPSDTAGTWILLGVLLRKRNSWCLSPNQPRSQRKSQKSRPVSGNRTSTESRQTRRS